MVYMRLEREVGCMLSDFAEILMRFACEPVRILSGFVCMVGLSNGNSLSRSEMAGNTHFQMGSSGKRHGARGCPAQYDDRRASS